MRRHLRPFFFVCIGALLAGLTACTTPPKGNLPSPYEMGEGHSNVDLITALNMQRDDDDLGFDEKSFNPCQYGLHRGNECRRQYLTVVHFQLLCRDTEGTVTEVPVDLQPIVANRVEWKLAGVSGMTRTNSEGYGAFSVVRPHSTRGKRLILQIGPQFVGFTVSEVTKIVLPKNFCRSDSV
jgi:hypothetical protein